MLANYSRLFIVMIHASDLLLIGGLCSFIVFLSLLPRFHHELEQVEGSKVMREVDLSMRRMLA